MLYPGYQMFFLRVVGRFINHYPGKDRKANCAIPASLLQKVMVSPGTPLEKNYESQSRTIASQLKKTMSPWVFM